MKYIAFAVVVSFLIGLGVFLMLHHNQEISTALQVTPEEIYSEPDAKKQIVVLLGGDVMLGRSVTVEALDRQNDATFPFKNLTPLFQSADIVFVNLETPVIANCPRQTSGMVFCSPTNMLEGFLPEKTVVNLANNHTANHGEKGIEETITHLTEKNISSTGRGALTIKTVQGTTFGFLGFDKDQQQNPTLTTAETELIHDSRGKVDVLIVAMHWGIEYNAHPTKGQIALAEKLSDLGVDVLVGHHPHWVQDVGKINTTVIFYSLGNLIFDQLWSEETRKGLLVRLTYEGSQLKSQELMPTYIDKIGQPIIMPSPNE